MIGEDKTMADRPWASEERARTWSLPAHLAMASSAWPVAGKFRFSPAVATRRALVHSRFRHALDSDLDDIVSLWK